MFGSAWGFLVSTAYLGFCFGARWDSGMWECRKSGTFAVLLCCVLCFCMIWVSVVVCSWEVLNTTVCEKDGEIHLNKILLKPWYWAWMLDKAKVKTGSHFASFMHISYVYNAFMHLAVLFHFVTVLIRVMKYLIDVQTTMLLLVLIELTQIIVNFEDLCAQIF